MRFFVSADESGNVKEVVCSKGTDTSKKDGQQPDLVQNLLQKHDLTTVKTRIVHLKTFQERWIVTARLGGFLNPVSLVAFEEHDFVLVAFESAKLFVVHFDGGKFTTAPLCIALPPRQTKNPTTLSAFVANPYVAGVFAYGGKDNDLQVIRLFDSSKKFSNADFADLKSWKVKTLFQAENVEPDHLDLEVPIWITNILFMQGEAKKKFKLVTATKYGHIRKYNTAEDTEPTELYKVCDKPIISMVFASENQDEVIISDTHTFVAKLSLTQVDKKAHRIISASAGTFYKPSLKLLGKFSEGGNTGAIYGVDVSFNAGLVAIGGLDRYLRVFDIGSRKLVLKVYLGTQISTIKMLDDTDSGDKEGDKRDAEEDDEFWNALDEGKDTNGGAPLLKKRKRNI
ncbi:hypothetical protein METBIDRAFT_76240 [Metschnikowia bicuspidata var. bicuspidata NRRL YB-4993]|uniref:Ribosome biogenesis protein NSA1 n=1 Tax=Metschnikowia bicuspidata var. bicuspidata NRRL YB-4993 TaxID=869754 RepID=A0A1A0HG90_9ASCO|nr:hypothetical protein METBIDRAFT_76240 [Metschnikowia bicuspidata var. bicuspidata NRRL YB-4993]OBA23179.1 hypothetical protein METBIDRAFT_76240 [Metschnikowia bicuspidata var. bicuspidata NRRL YB-4993]